MKVEEEGTHELPTSLLLVLSVVLTVLVALFLTFSDDLQTPLPVPIRPTAVVQSDLPPTPIPPQPTASAPASQTPGQTNEPTAPPTATTVSIIAEVSCNNAPADWIPVVVGPDDTLYTLSIRYGATMSEIIQANCLEGKAIFSGMILYLPPAPPTRTPCGPPQWWVTYIVRPGDTLSRLARKHGTSVYAIMQANCMSDTRIFAGRSLYLPPLPSTVPPPPTVVLPTRTPFATPTGAASPTPSATADGTALPTATATPPSGTAVPTNTATATGTPPVTGTSLPTASSTPESSPTATPSPPTEPTGTAVPSATPTSPPTNTPQPTQPPPTNTSQPTATDPPPPSETPES